MYIHSKCLHYRCIYNIVLFPGCTKIVHRLIIIDLNRSLLSPFGQPMLEHGDDRSHDDSWLMKTQKIFFLDMLNMKPSMR